MPQAENAAQSGIAVLRQLVTDQNFRDMGFDSRDQVDHAQIDQPWSLFNIGLDQLKTYQAGTNADALLQPSADTIFPVSVSGQVKSSVTVTHGDKGFTPSSFGSAPIVKELAKYRQSGAFVVRVPALSMYFVGTRVDGRLMLTPIIADPRLKAEVGVATPAQQIIEQLVPIANGYNGLPM